MGYRTATRVIGPREEEGQAGVGDRIGGRGGRASAPLGCFFFVISLAFFPIYLLFLCAAVFGKEIRWP